MSAATSNDAVQPQWSASQGVRLGEMRPSKDDGPKSWTSRKGFRILLHRKAALSRKHLFSSLIKYAIMRINEVCHG